MDNCFNNLTDEIRIILTRFEERAVEQLHAVEKSINTVSYDVSRRLQIVNEHLDDVRRAISSLHDVTQSANKLSPDTFEYVEESAEFEDTEGSKEDLERIWRSALMFIRAHIGSEAAFKTWFRETRIEQLNAENRTVTIKTKTPFVRQWLEGHYSALVEQALSIVTNQELQVRFVTEHKP
ncbi:hypothetical protein NZD89_07615 [Alicyclobacillus fastidiosus]|uniref:DnaA N-terminal domain-containing protein n=1 Tax=Alicyclobacillus fastidiosus TaxID=392011 RepID=A0ABY6ZK49_9BACL|nr:DnaA N-terminal domain-containing protein [Alicyclobacillus fastidiosus]WAH43254.1 hypothetical protein NZD89_07615 [Alicyclobacillus fastidiosus]GMA65297.1 hypothetical protein GCM10025859_57370 [Alicyclobacillus fastidiosus]